MKKSIVLSFLFLTTFAFSQKLDKLPESNIPAIETEVHLRLDRKSVV